MKKKYNPAVFLGLLAFVLAFNTSALAAVQVDFRELVKASIPAVVNISTERTEQMRQANPFGFFRGHPDMDRFFGPFEDFYNEQPMQRKTNSLGSGFIISADGYIVTNNHVVEGADVISVTIGGKNKKEDQLKAEVVGLDPETDLALIKVKADDLPYLRFGDSDALDVGEWVVAIGSPLGLDHTVTAGIVSAKGRNIQSGSYDDYLQTDASINRGNSGGPLLNMAGEVIGINTAIAQRAQGIGFAIPSSMAKGIVDSLQTSKKVSRGWLGVTIQNVDSATAKALGMAENRGALVNSVLEGQPAALAGIKEGDVILAINDKAIENTEQLLRTVAALKPGSEAGLTVWRDSKSVKLTLTVAERDPAQGKGGEQQPGKTGEDKLIGLKVRPITNEEARRMDLGINAGLLVTAVDNSSLAAQSGIQAGDVVLAVNRQPVASVSDLSKYLKEAEKQRGAALLHIFRNGQVFFRAIELGKQ